MHRLRLALCAAAVLALVLAASAAHAHRCMVFAYVDGDSVVVEGSFGGGNPAMNSRVTATSATGDIIAEGTTDGQGIWEFTLPEGLTGDITIDLYAGEGHAGDWVVKENEYRN